MAETKNIIFDLGGVLLDLDVTRTHHALREIGLLDIETLFKNGMATSFFKQYEAGDLTDQEFINAVRHASGWRGPDSAIIDGWTAMLVSFPPRTIEWLSELKDRYRLFLFSNTNALHLKHFRELYRSAYGEGNFDNHFEKTYYSHEVGVRKPDPEAYEMVVRENQLEKDLTVFVDDVLSNVEAARSIGIRGIHLEPGVAVTSLSF